MIRFADGWFLLGIPIVISLFWAAKKKRGFKFSSVKLFKRADTGKTVKHKIGKALVLCGLILSLVALARPQTTEKIDIIRQRGVDIAMLLDVSGSMQSIDLHRSSYGPCG